MIAPINGISANSELSTTQTRKTDRARDSLPEQTRQRGGVAVRHVVARRWPHLGKAVEGLGLLLVYDDDPDVGVPDEVVEALVEAGLRLEDEGGVDGAAVVEVVVGGLCKIRPWSISRFAK